MDEPLKYCYKCQVKKAEFYKGSSICTDCYIKIQTANYHEKMKSPIFQELEKARRMEKYWRRLKEQYAAIQQQGFNNKPSPVIELKPISKGREVILG